MCINHRDLSVFLLCLTAMLLSSVAFASTAHDEMGWGSTTTVSLVLENPYTNGHSEARTIDTPSSLSGTITVNRRGELAQNQVKLFWKRDYNTWPLYEGEPSWASQEYNFFLNSTETSKIYHEFPIGNSLAPPPDGVTTWKQAYKYTALIMAGNQPRSSNVIIWFTDESPFQGLLLQETL